MNYVIGKFSRSISFDDKRWSANGGDNEPSLIYIKIAELNPNDTFYMIGKSDIKKCRNIVPSNIIDVWEDCLPQNNDSIIEEYYQNYILNYFKNNNINIDSGILMSGPVGINIPNKIRLLNNNAVCCKTLLMFSRYSGPIVQYLNVSKLRYIILSPDPRYIKMQRDSINCPVLSISQYNTIIKYNVIESYENQNKDDFITCKIPVLYSKLETIFLINKPQLTITKFTKDIKFLLVLNEGGNKGLLRGPFVDEYLLNSKLNYLSNIEIYGKWNNERYKDDRFKGPVLFNKLIDKLKRTKYTLLIPIDKGWVTGKFWEMIYYGIVPFLHPYYDSQKNIEGLPEFLRVNSPNELETKIQYLEDNPSKYTEIVDELQRMLLPEYFSGMYLNNIIMKYVNELCNNNEYKNVTYYSQLLNNIVDNNHYDNETLLQFIDFLSTF